jgi:hypothetical protein
MISAPVRRTTAWMILCCCLTLPAAAQDTPKRYAIGVKAGISPYDLDGSGTAFAVGLVGHGRVGRNFLIEVGVPILFYTHEEFGGDLVDRRDVRLVLPEVSLQAEVSAGQARPYVFAGAGAALASSPFLQDGATLHAGVGVRFPAGRNTLIQTEARARSVRPWEAETLDLTLGIQWRVE